MLFRLVSPTWNRLERAVWDDYQVSADGQRFLVSVGLTRTQTMPLTVVLNWKPTK